MKKPEPTNVGRICGSRLSGRCWPLRRKIRSDAGQQRSVETDLARLLEAQYRAHQRWSYQLHADNIRVVVVANPQYGRMPSYSTIVRYMKSHGWIRRPVSGGKRTPGIERAQARLETREVRSYEVAHVNALWHLDFHQDRKSTRLNSSHGYI